MPYERLSPADASLLHLESPRVPMHAGAVAVFEGDPFRDAEGRFRIDDVRRYVDDRLHLVPRYRRRLRTVPLGQGRPVWVDDDRFDLGYHVRLTALPRPGDDQQLLALAARLQAHQLDRNRPLWELWFVEGLEGGRVAIVLKTHHVLSDPGGGPDLASVLVTPDVTTPPGADVPTPAWDAAPAPGSVQLLAAALAQRVTDPAEIVRSVRAAVRGPRRALGAAVATTRVLGRIGRAATRLPFNGPIGPHRRIATVRFPAARVEAIRAGAGATLDDLVLATVTGALRTYLDAGGHTLDGVDIRALAPRPGASVAAVPVDGSVVELPVSDTDALARLRSIAAQRAPDGPPAAGPAELLTIAGLGPPAVVGLAGRLLPYQRAVNLAVAAVDGPRAPVRLFGARMLEAFPYVGPVDGLALVVTALSAGDHLTFALCADRDAVPDLGVLADGLERAIDELERAVTTGTRG